MKHFRICAIIALLSILYTVQADENTLVLQNGLNDYTGCSDSYIGTSNYTVSPSYVPSSNFENNVELRVHKESC